MHRMRVETSRIDPQSLSSRQFYQYLACAVAPRPIALASTVDAQGRVNLSPFSFFNVFSSDPPILVFSPVNRGRDGSAKDTLLNIADTPEVVVNLVTEDMVRQTSLSSASYPRGVNEFEKAGLRQIASDVVQPPRVAESPIAFECVVDRVIALAEGPGAGNLVLARIVLMHCHQSILDDDHLPDAAKLNLVGRMGRNLYCRTSSALFEVEKPLSGIGIGVDQLPSEVRQSSVLTGSELAILGGQVTMPTAHEIDEASKNYKVSRKDKKDDLHPSIGTESLHKCVQDLIRRGAAREALSLLLAFSGEG